MLRPALPLVGGLAAGSGVAAKRIDHLLGELAEPIGMTDYEVIRTAYEVGRRGLTGMSFICIPPGSAVMYRVIVYVITYLMAGLSMRRQAGRSLMPGRLT